MHRHRPSPTLHSRKYYIALERSVRLRFVLLERAETEMLSIESQLEIGCSLWSALICLPKYMAIRAL
jgi:hypothetical protein